MSADETTFEGFLERHRLWLEHLARTIAAQTDTDHHTLFSGTITVLHRRWHTITPPVEAVQKRFARTVMENQRRDQEKRVVRVEAPTADLQAILDRQVPTDQWSSDPEFEILMKDRQLRIFRCIAKLPHLERDIMRLVGQEYSRPEIATSLGIPFDEVRNGILRARRHLQPLLDEEDDDDR